MRIKLLIPLAGVVALSSLLIQGAGSAPVPPSQKKAIAAKKAEAQQVLDEIASIDESLNTISEQYDGARVRLQALRKNLAAEKISLAKAKARYQRAQQRAAKLLVWMYTQSHGNSLDVILGARSLSELLRLSDEEHQLSLQAATIATQAATAKHNLQLAVQRLDRDRKAAAATVKELSDRRNEIEQGLAERQRLLASVEGEVQKLEAVERARQPPGRARGARPGGGEGGGRSSRSARRSAGQGGSAGQGEGSGGGGEHDDDDHHHDDDHDDRPDGDDHHRRGDDGHDACPAHDHDRRRPRSCRRPRPRSRPRRRP